MLPVGGLRIQYLFWQWSSDRKIRTSLPQPWIFLDALKLVTSQSSNELDFSSICYHWPAGHIPARLLGATHRPFPHSCKQRHQFEAPVDKIQWFVWNCPPEPRPHFFMLAHWSVMRERSISGIFIDKFPVSFIFCLQTNVNFTRVCLCKIIFIHCFNFIYARKKFTRQWKYTQRRLKAPRLTFYWKDIL